MLATAQQKGTDLVLPFTSLDGATTVSDGTAKDLECPLANHTLIATNPTGGQYTVQLQGSHDGSNWVTLGSANGGSVVTIESHHTVRYVRARLSAISTGSPTVTATIADT